MLPVPLTPAQQYAQLQADFVEAKQRLVEAEAELAQYQGQINAFRMHCRLKLDDLVEKMMALQSEKQLLLTNQELARQENQQQQSAEEGVINPAGGDLWPALTNDRAAEKRLYRELARRFHPDLSGDNMEVAYRTSLMALVNRAYAAHDIQTLYDLAGEPDPMEVAELGLMTAGYARKLSDQMMRCKRRQRKVEQQLKALLQEKSARIWQQAQAMAWQGENWWDEVRLNLNKAIEQLTAEIEQLREGSALNSDLTLPSVNRSRPESTS